MGDHVTHCHKIYNDTMCGAHLDETQTHALTCQLQGSTVHRHNRIRDTIAHILRETGQNNDVQIEQLVPEASEASVAPQMDIIAHGPLGQRDLIDVTVACAHTSTALRCGSGTRLGAAAHMLETNKYRKYPGVQVTPAALETGGRPGDGSVNLIRKLGRNMNKTERPSSSVKLGNRSAQRSSLETPVRSSQRAVPHRDPWPSGPGRKPPIFLSPAHPQYDCICSTLKPWFGSGLRKSLSHSTWLHSSCLLRFFSSLRRS